MILDTDLLVAVLRDDEDAIKKIKELERSNDNMFITSVNTFELFRGAFKSRYVEDNLIVVSELINKFDKIIEFDLVASQIAAKVFTKLQDELSDTENKIQAARRFYNTNVMTLNTQVESFPTNLIASSFGFHKEEFFQLNEEAAREPVPVKF